MARLADLPLKYRVFMAAYPFRRVRPLDWTPLSKDLSSCRVALVTTAAYYLPDQEPFDEGFRGGDPSYRSIPLGGSAEALSSLEIGHRSAAFDHAGIEDDRELALPASVFRDLEREGVIGSLHETALSFMGSITAPGRLVKQSAPAAADELRSAEVDVAFLVPV